MALKLANIDRNKLTPMMQQYLAAKDRRPDCLIFFRLGDFYEMFFDDAEVVARELELKLTGRDCGLSERAPMCGVPHHAAKNYIDRLLRRGYKVAICEQVEDPATATGVVKREIIRVITPGTQLEPETLDAQQYVYIAAIYAEADSYGLAACDLSSGHFETTYCLGAVAAEQLYAELDRFQAIEYVVNREFSEQKRFQEMRERLQLTVTILPDDKFSRQLALQYGLELTDNALLWYRASAALLSYLDDTQNQPPNHLGEIRPYQLTTYMQLDHAARTNLELTETLRDRKRRGSLLWAVDYTKTAMGSRLLRSWLEQPLLQKDIILARQHVVALFKDNYILRQALREALTGLYDMERLAGKIASRNLNPRDLLSLLDALKKLPRFYELLSAEQDPAVQAILHSIQLLPELTHNLDKALREDAPLTITEGGIFKSGYNQRRDELEELHLHGKDFILRLEAEERENTGIKTLKVGYNRVFGYYLEVSKGQVEYVPEYYIRKQTLTNSERYVTPKLKQQEDSILAAEQQLRSLEYDLFVNLREEVAANLNACQATSRALARLDTLLSFAELAERHRYCRPTLTEDTILKIEEGRHPVVERMLQDCDFVPNSLTMDTADNYVMVLTGPNMSGKSTFMRQTALIVLLAQCGSFVPANSAVIGICDRIFTRVGASDDVSGGRSTFMVEMSEVANILRQASSRSLLILDEIGRGTSTMDGLALAWSVVEHISDAARLGARTLFATHFHELVELSDTLSGVFNTHVTVAQEHDEIVFLHRIKAGGTDRSYGLEVAKLAGVPTIVVDRAREILHALESGQAKKRLILKRQAQPMDGQIDLFTTSQSVKTADALIAKLDEADPDNMRPVEAYSLLLDLKTMAAKQKSLRGRTENSEK